MAKKNTLNDLNEFLKETQEGQDTNTTEAKTTKEAFLAKEPSQLVDVNKVEKAATGTKKAPAKTTATKTTAKKTATKTATKATTSKSTAKKTATTKKATTTKASTKTTAGKTTTTKKAPAKATATKATPKKATPKKTTAPKVEATEEAILKQLDALAQKEGVTMREIWERVAVKIGATNSTKPTVAEEAFDSLVDIAMTPMNFLVSVSDRINKML
ncbi:hypothetical protein BKI52_23460 [marine bacterium AO1-C]|nr:hypothetical protein BKI52_23460 [marine bacterium AO1-C]